MTTKKELKDAYKQAKIKMGVFQIRNTVNNKLYIDSHVNLPAIWNRHKTELNFGGHRNAALQSEWNEFGEASFLFEILAEIQPKETEITDYAKELKALAAMYIEELQPFDGKGYNRK